MAVLCHVEPAAASPALQARLDLGAGRWTSRDRLSSPRHVPVILAGQVPRSVGRGSRVLDRSWAHARISSTCVRVVTRYEFLSLHLGAGGSLVRVAGGHASLSDRRIIILQFRYRARVRRPLGRSSSLVLLQVVRDWASAALAQCARCWASSVDGRHVLAQGASWYPFTGAARSGRGPNLIGSSGMIIAVSRVVLMERIQAGVVGCVRVGGGRGWRS